MIVHMPTAVATVEALMNKAVEAEERKAQRASGAKEYEEHVVNCVTEYVEREPSMPHVVRAILEKGAERASNKARILADRQRAHSHEALKLEAIKNEVLTVLRREP